MVWASLPCLPPRMEWQTLLEPWTTMHLIFFAAVLSFSLVYLCNSYYHPLPLHSLVLLHYLSSLNKLIIFRLVWNFLPICLFNFIWIILLHHWKTSPNTTYLKYLSSHRCSYRLYAPVAPYHRLIYKKFLT